MAETVEFIAETMRGRILRGLQTKTLLVGDRLPSARMLAREFAVDFRVVLSAYRVLSSEGLVDLRARGGVYVSANGLGAPGVPPLPESWIVDVLTQSLARETPAAELYEWIRRCTETLRLRALVIGSTEDQVYGLCRELSDDFGLDAEGLTADRVRAAPRDASVRRADLFVTTKAHAGWVHDFAAGQHKPVIVIDVRPDLLTGEWALLLRQPVYVIVATEDFGRMLREFFRDVPEIENLHILVFGRDDLATIPPDAPTYVTQRVRASLGSEKIAGRVLPAARTIRTESARELFAFIVRSNIAALSGRAR